ncbi:MAG: prolyl oligopeptidase family serine peptidase [Bdellovibrionales bacterium]|nr:prolyl oligopeptidase family serine peptidase [Bdellovibrionales bacterium]
MGKELKILALLSVFCAGIAFAAPPARDPDSIYFPKNYQTEPNRKWPLVVLLHGYKVSGKFQKKYFRISQQQINKRGFILLIPGTTYDQKGFRFWNAMDYCCDHFGSGVDDVGYLRATVQKAIAQYNVDPSRVSVLGHSNGGFMMHRMICDHADLFSSAVSLAGASYRDLNQCKPSSPVALMMIQGKKDWRVPFEGMNEKTLQKRLKKREGIYPYSSNEALVRFPGVEETTRYWALKNGCSGKDGPEHYQDGCKRGAEVVMDVHPAWGHVPLILPGMRDKILDFLLCHSK